jgi:integrase
MPRTRTIPAYRLHTASGQARVILNGRHIYLGRYDSEESRASYEKVVRKLLTDRAASDIEANVLISKDLTVAELVAAYLKFARTYYVKRGRVTPEFDHIFLTLRLVTERYGHDLITTLGPLKVKAIRAEWIKAGMVRGQINKRIGRIRRMVAWGVEEELVPASVHHALKAIAGLKKGRTEAPEGRRVLPVPETWVDAIRPHVSRQVWAMVELQRLCGARPGEIVMLRTIDINMSGRIWEFRPIESKMEHLGSDRVVYVGPQAQEILRPWLRTELEAFLFSPREVLAEWWADRRAQHKTPVQPSQRNRKKRRPQRAPADRYSSKSYARAIRTACLNAGVPHWAPNQLRHVVGTKVRQEMGLEASQVVLGHARADVTQVYAERNAELAKQAMQKLG